MLLVDKNGISSAWIWIPHCDLWFLQEEILFKGKVSSNFCPNRQGKG